MTPRRRFWHVAGAGTAFQAGSAAVDSATVMSALVYQLTGSAVAVGAVSTILRLGWLLPQLFVGYFAGRGASSMPFYVVGAFGRTAAIAMLAIALWLGAKFGGTYAALGTVTLVLWVLYAFLSGIVGVPYNDIVAPSVPSERRSRMLSIRFFGGGIVALLVAALADKLFRTLDFPISYSAVLGIAASLMLVSSFIFTARGGCDVSRRSSVPPLRFCTMVRRRGSHCRSIFYRRGQQAWGRFGKRGAFARCPDRGSACGKSVMGLVGR